MRIHRRSVLPLLAALASLWLAAPALAQKTKSLSGKIRRVEGSLLTIKKSGLVNSSEVEVHLADDTRKHGQIAPGMHIKVQYREEKTAEGAKRLVALEVETRPEYASKDARKLQKRDP